ncbi:MAG: hypothetical protein ABEJ43_10895 [Haloferacaceae archaeon]
MSLQLTEAVTDGVGRVFTRTGAVLFALLAAQQALLVTSLNTVVAAEMPPAAAGVVGLTLPIPSPVALALAAGSALLGTVALVVLARAFARPRPELSSFPASLLTRRIGRASLTALVGGTVVAVTVTLGLPFLLVPGLFLATCFALVPFAVGVEDRGTVGALRRSWRLSRGSRLRLGSVVLAAGAGGVAVGIVPAILQMAGAAGAGDVVTVLLNGTLTTLVYGVLAAAYRQLTDEDDGFGGAEPSTVSIGEAGSRA